MKTFLLLLFSSLALAQSQSKKVLFVGNSQTFTNNLPNLVGNMATSTGDNLVFTTRAQAGVGLEDHLANTTTMAAVAAGDWDYVVLQDRSQAPALPIDYVEEFVYPTAAEFNELILKANPCTETIFYITWGWRDGDDQFCDINPPVCTYQGMDDLVTERLMNITENNEAIAAPAGPLWRYLRNNHPSINLFASDGIHGNIAGSYAAACSFYTVIFRKDPTLITFNSTLPAATAAIIRQAAKTVVFDQLTNWKVGTYDPIASFTAAGIGNGNYQFTNLSSQADSYHWDFGDGQVSTEAQPTHTYTVPGDYTVTLTASRCGYESQYSLAVNGVLGMSSDTPTHPVVVPNPTTGVCLFTLPNPIALKEVFTVEGRRIASWEGNEPSLDTTGWSPGVYIVRLTDALGQVSSTRLIKE